MSTYLSLIEPNQAPQLLCARGILIPLSRKQSCPGKDAVSALEVGYDRQQQAELFVLAADRGWAVSPHSIVNSSELYPYGKARAISGSPNLSVMVSRYDPELNLSGSIEERSAAPVAKLTVSLLGQTHTTMLRSGDAIPVGGPLFPLPYLELVTKCRLEVTSSDAILIVPNEAMKLDDTSIVSECILNRRSTAAQLSGDGWLVELQFLPYTVDSSFHGTQVSQSPSRAY